MDSNSLVVSKDQKGKLGVLVEVSKAEKQLWTWIHTKGLLHSDVQELYRKVCSSYEQIILKDHKLPEIQDVEYSFWKLHYRHIDEFRKRIKRLPGYDEITGLGTQQNAQASDRDDCNYVEGFKSFLSEASDVYRNFIVKIKKHYGLREAFSFHGTSENSTSSIEPENMRMLKFLWHRFLVCLGDLARYKEQCEKTTLQNQNWSAAVAYYLEAIRIWPESGNPQNQLAVLATYVGDDFLALYHCIRSLAVKEPFPDAWNNLILLFERNRSSHFHSFPSDACFDFLKPSQRSKPIAEVSSCKAVQVDHESSSNSGLWPIIVRTISFFFLPSSLEDFSGTFAAMMTELDALLTLDEVKLKCALESYRHMDSARNGPFRILQVVCIFIFVIENQTRGSEANHIADNHDQQLLLTRMAFASAIIFMGRIVERCQNASSLECCSLLPALLVFVERLENILEKAEAFASDEKVESAMAYFFGALVEFLMQIDISGEKVEASSNAALWEDFELQGFASASPLHTSLEYSTVEGADRFEIGTRRRLERIVDAAMQIANRSNYSRRWFSYDKSTQKFCVTEKTKLPNVDGLELVGLGSTSSEMKECYQQISKDEKESDEVILVMNNRDAGKSVAMDEEEVILFKPLTRYNSAPILCSITSNKHVPAKDADSQSLPADESLRRATSLLMAQNQAHSGPADFHFEVTKVGGNGQFKQSGSLPGDEVAYAPLKASISPSSPPFRPSINAGPPSLNAWVLDRDIMENERAKSRSHASKPSLEPIEEVVSTSLMDLSINQTESPISSTPEPLSNVYSSPNYSALAPSAPFLPDNAVWFNSNASTSPDLNSFGNPSRMNHLYSSPPVNSYSNWTTQQPLDYAIGIPGYIEGYQPGRPLLTSSEWLRQYREANRWPSPPYTAAKASNFPDHQMYRHSLFDQCGTPPAPGSFIYVESPALHTGVPLVSGGDGNRREMFFTSLQRPSPYGCSAINEPEPLMHYLKKKEWLLQQDPALRGPTYMGS